MLDLYNSKGWILHSRNGPILQTFESCIPLLNLETRSGFAKFLSNFIQMDGQLPMIKLHCHALTMGALLAYVPNLCIGAWFHERIELDSSISLILLKGQNSLESYLSRRKFFNYVFKAMMFMLSDQHSRKSVNSNKVQCVSRSQRFS